MADPSKNSPDSGKQQEKTNEPKLEGEALVAALKKQLEFYFSKDNLATDKFLLSQMNNDKFVPVDVIASFRKVKQLTEDKSLLVKVMRECKNLNTDENGTMVRPVLKAERNTLILRDMPSNASMDEVKAIFDANGCPAKPVMVRSDIDDQWFVTFEREDACLDTVQWVQGRTFRDKPIRARVKTERVLPLPTKEPAFGSQAAPSWQVTPDNAGAGAGFTGGFGPQFSPMITGMGAITGQYYDGSPSFGPQGKKGKGKRKGGSASSTPVSSEAGMSGRSRQPVETLPRVAIRNGYSGTYLSYTKSEMADIIDKFSTSAEFSRAESLPDAKDSGVVRAEPFKRHMLRDVMPIMFPASPSPMFAAQPPASNQMPPLDLGSSAPASGSDTLAVPSAAAAAAAANKKNERKSVTAESKPQEPTEPKHTGKDNAAKSEKTESNKAEKEKEKAGNKKEGKKEKGDKSSAKGTSEKDKQEKKPATEDKDSNSNSAAKDKETSSKESADKDGKEKKKGKGGKSPAGPTGKSGSSSSGTTRQGKGVKHLGPAPKSAASSQAKVDPNSFLAKVLAKPAAPAASSSSAANPASSTAAAGSTAAPSASNAAAAGSNGQAQNSSSAPGSGSSSSSGKDKDKGKSGKSGRSGGQGKGRGRDKGRNQQRAPSSSSSASAAAGADGDKAGTASPSSDKKSWAALLKP